MIQFFNKFTDPKTPYSNHIDLNDWYEGTNEELQQIDAGRHAPETVQSKDALLALVREKCAASPTCVWRKCPPWGVPGFLGVP